MNTKSTTDNAFSRIVTYMLLVIGLIYVILVVWGIATQDPATGYIKDNIKFLMEIGTMLSALVLLLFTVSVHQNAKENNNSFGIISIIFMALLVATTFISHFVSITLSKQLTMVWENYKYVGSMEWPSVLFAIDILAWDVFFGLAFLSLGISVLQNSKNSLVGILMICSGILSLLGLAAIPLNNMNVRYIGIFGYTVMPLISCVFYVRKRD